MKHNVIFLDRDGIINKKPPGADYVKQWSDFEFLPGAISGLKFLTKKGYEIFIVTNQAGVARGLMTLSDLETIHEKLIERCKKEKISIKRIYFCPHGWNDECECRKPKPGMLLQAAQENNFDITKALFIGDDERDKKAGDAAGCKTVLMEADGNLLQNLQLLII